MNKTLLTVLLPIVLTGCAASPTIVNKTDYIVLNIDPRYLRDCTLVAPPDEEVYMKASMDEREDMLTRTIIDQHQATRECTNDKRAIRKVVETQKEYIESQTGEKK